MTGVEFLADEKGLCGFTISGHSSVNCDDEIGKIVCSAVSSAAYLTANTITDVIGDSARIEVRDGFISLCVNSPTKATYQLIKGLKLHLTQLSEEYSNNIRIYGGAKHVKD